MMLDCDIEVNELGAEHFDALFDISLNLSVDMDDTGNALKLYAEQIQFINNLLIPFEHSVFQSITSILSEGLSNIIDENRQLEEAECQFLKRIPEIAFEYAFIPDSKIPDVHLLNHFKDQGWVRPVNADEEEILLHYLVDESVGSPEEEQNIDVIDLSIENEIEIDDIESSLMDEVSSDIDNVVIKDVNINKNESDSESYKPDNSVLDVNDVVMESMVDNEENLSIDDINDFSVEDDIIDIANFISDDNEPKSIDDFESEVDLMDLIGIQPDCESNDLLDESSANHLNDPHSVETEVSVSINKEQKELVDLISDELKEIIEDKDLITVASLEYSSELKDHLINIAEQIENISNAIDLIGLEGLGEISRNISSNLHMLALNKKTLTHDQQSLIEVWPDKILSYLNNIGNHDVSSELIQYLTNPAWPDIPSKSVIESAKASLLTPQLKEEEKSLRQQVACAEDMSLILPEDVNPELLEGLLQDLPLQTGEFSVAIQNLQNEHNIEYLEVAQRIAHTLKGAGNVVGVKGIANLTHNLEDILEIQSKANKLPSGELLVVLIDAADCLETMSEALLGIDEPPDNGLFIYQSVLDWANKLDVNGATDIGLDLLDSNKNEKIVEVSAEEINKEKNDNNLNKKSLNIESMLRVPAKLADDLLRLAGENLISTSQIQEYIKIIQNRYKSLKNQDQSLQKFSYDLEHIVDVQGITNHGVKNNHNNDGFDPLELDQYHELHSMSRRLVELSADSIELTQLLEKDFTELQNLVINQGRLQKENEQLVLRTRMVPTSTIIPRLKRGVKQACRLSGKLVDLNVNDNGTFMDSEVLNSLIEPLMHILRNSVGHGIEENTQRINAGKDEKGMIDLIFLQRGDQVVIEIKDDGRGLSLNDIRSKAISLGLASIDSDVTEANLQKYILQPGFSTRSEVNHMSGRGIGLDVVNSKIRELKGSIEIKSEEGVGCQFILILPISSFSVHSLLVRVRENIYAFSNRGIEEILYPGLGELQKVGKDTMFKLDDQLYNISMIEGLLNMPEDRREDDRANRPVLLVKDDSGSRSAILVQEVIDSRDVVVKSMGPYMPKIPGIVGATVLGDGSIVPVVDLPELMQSVQIVDKEIHYSSENADLQKVEKIPYVLVVDDSLSARKSLAQFVEDLGLQVRTARDGMEAVSLIDVRRPDLILVDMEMPRMNGLELTGHIRASSVTENLPVIMITSRSTDKHRKAAMDKGVDHYMVKPFAEDELATHINLALKSA